MRKLGIIDGHSLANRAFYALPRLTTSEGIATNAAYGFVTMLLRLIEDERPDYLAVAFDVGKPTFRHQEFKEYKANRTATPEDLVSQIPIIKEILAAFRIPIFEVEGYEADDVIGTITRMAKEKHLATLVVTGDKDALQLVDENTRAMITRKGISDIVTYDRSAVEKQYGISPEQIPDLKGLMGDQSDNIPGVRGVGEKTAMKLLKEHGTVENILAHIGEIKEKRVRELLEKYGDQAIVSKRLATIDRNVPLSWDPESCKWLGPDLSRVKEIFERLEFKSLLKRVLEKWGQDRALPDEPSDSPCVSIELNGIEHLPPDDLAGFYLEAKSCRGICIDAEPFQEQNGVQLALITRTGKSCIVDLADHSGVSLVDHGRSGDSKGLKDLLEDGSIAKWGYNLKPLILALRKMGIRLKKVDFDVLVGAYLIDSARASYKLEDLAREYAGDKPCQHVSSNAAGRAMTTLMIKKPMCERLHNDGLWELFSRVEMPLVEVLADMEWNGIKVDLDKARSMAREFESRMDLVAEEIYQMAGERFNINSPKQLGTILFEKMGLPNVKKTKTGYSTDSEVLEALAGQHEIALRVLEYRYLAKLKGTYLDGIERLVSEDGKIHTTFNQTVTATGRISSTEPNLQNIPIKAEFGKRIREVFVPSHPGWLFLSADYSQIELRVLAHIAADADLIDAFQKDEDIHHRTAAEVFGVEYHQVTPEMRSKAKAVNFGIVYGISDFGLAKSIGVSRSQAKKYIDSYFQRYPGVKKYIDDTISLARRQGYVCTILNRRRYLPDINSPNRNLRLMSERIAINAPIQGSAADIIKLAMIRVHSEIEARGLKARMLLQVHDELVFEAPENEIEVLKGIVKDCMEGALPLSVPLKVDIKQGPDWYHMI